MKRKLTGRIDKLIFEKSDNIRKCNNKEPTNNERRKIKYTFNKHSTNETLTNK